MEAKHPEQHLEMWFVPHHGSNNKSGSLLDLKIGHKPQNFCTWFFAFLVIPSFCLTFNVLSLVLHTRLSLPHSILAPFYSFSIIYGHWILL
jgi:hypothetical protein